jgi:hypothetical protein
LKENKIVYLNDKFYASCPVCRSQAWLLEIDGPGDQWESLQGSECANCGFFVEWKAIKE